MKARYALIRTAFPLLVGVGLIAVALWLFGAAPVRSASNALLDDSSPSIAPAPLQAQDVITIPQGISVTVDARCDPASEYKDAASYDFTDVDASGAPISGTVYLKHDGAYLYICMKGSNGGYPDRFARIYLDTTNDRESYAGPNDFALQIGIVTPTPSSYKGTGVANGYVATPINGWSAATTWGNGDMAEYKIPINVTGGWCGAHFGLAVYHHWVLAVGNDYGWPSNKFFDQPQTWQEVVLGGTAPCGSGKIAYVYKRDTATAGAFKGLLEGNGFTVQLVPLSVVTSTDFTAFNLVIIADDTGSLDTWGTGAGQTTTIVSAGKPIVGLGEGGYAFFGQLGLGIGWPHGWHGPQDQVYGLAASLSYYHTPYDFAGLVPGPFPLYGAPVNEVGIYLPKNPNVLPIGLEPPYAAGALADHAPLIAEKINADLAGCNQLWGYSGGPKQMNLSGDRLFVNAVTYGLAQAKQCAPTPPPPTPCVTISKSATPPDGTHVKPGDTISYTINYTVTGSANCPAVVRAELVDKIPMDTLYVPNSASGGGTPNTGALIWNLGPLSAGTYTQTFQVYVLDTQCQDQRRVNNVARLQTNLGVVNSNLVTHPVDCPPVTFPTTQPPYAEDDLGIYPYPLITGKPTQVSVRVRNLSATTQTLTVTFQTSPDRFGIGLGYAALTVPGNPKAVTLPPNGIAIVKIDWTPVSSGHYCMQVRVEGAGFDPIFTSRNLDVTEDLRPGVEDVLTFTVGNPTPSPANILLAVDNTCPGWSAIVTPTLLSNVGALDSDIRKAELHVTPPISTPLGTSCHIDVQGWINGKLIGGIRKLDVPPVRLQPSNPPWEEKEISVNPDPPTPGQTISFCVELQNPLPFSRTVDLVYSYADFGAGIPFTPIQTRTVTLPPYSMDKYCINWPTPTTGTLHKCLLITLKQPGFQDQRSQHNVDFVRPIHGFAGITVTFGIDNPDPFTRTLIISPVLVGIDPNLWIPHILPDPPPDLMPNETRMFTFELVPAVNAMATDVTAASNDSGFGDSNRAEVGVYLDDELLSGFTVDYTPIRLYLPIVVKP
jgi:uncharacterized repeat protein (TIGR01451 family)